MLKGWKLFEEFERELARSTAVDYRANLRIVEELFKQAKALGLFPLKDPLEGLDVDIKRTRIFNSVRRTPDTNSTGL